jgi:hypothetical protein
MMAVTAAKRALSAHQQVRKRDVSFGPGTPDGVRAWGLFMGLAATARGWVIALYEYLNDGIPKINQIMWLASLIEPRASELALSAT